MLLHAIRHRMTYFTRVSADSKVITAKYAAFGCKAVPFLYTIFFNDES